MPAGPFDLIVVSEIAYYLSRRDLSDLAARLIRATAPGGRVVVLHHVIAFDDAAQLPALAQASLCQALRRSMKQVRLRRLGRYEVAAFDKPQGKG